MSGREGLRAEVRTDKNGHSVTRWVRDTAEGTASGGRRGIPAPRRGFDREAAIETILRAIVRGQPGRLLDKHRDRLEKFEDSTLVAITTALRSRTLSAKDLDDIIFVFREGKELRPMVVYAESFHPESHWDDSADIVGMLGAYPPFEGLGDPSAFTGTEKEQAASLVRAASTLAAALSGQVSPRTVMERLLKDGDLCDLLVGNPESAEALFPVLRERGWLSSSEVADLLSVTSPLRDGML